MKKKTSLLIFLLLSCSGEINSPQEKQRTLNDYTPPTVDYICDLGSLQTCLIEENKGPCSLGARICYGNFWSNCEQFQNPMEEVCDNVDNDCDGPIDEGLSKKISCEVESFNQWIVYNDVFEASGCKRGWRFCVNFYSIHFPTVFTKHIGQ